MIEIEPRTDGNGFLEKIDGVGSLTFGIIDISEEETNWVEEDEKDE